MGHPEVRWSIVSSCCLHNRLLLSISSFKILFLKKFCTNCLVLNRHYFIFSFSLNVSKFYQSIRLLIIHEFFLLCYVTVVHASPSLAIFLLSSLLCCPLFLLFLPVILYWGFLPIRNIVELVLCWSFLTFCICWSSLLSYSISFVTSAE